MGDKLRGGTTIGGNIAYHAGNIPTWNQDTTGNAGTATKLATARTISLTGDSTGSASFDGSGNVSIAVTSQTTSNLLTNILAVDGTGSGIDADLLDGIQASSFLRSDTNSEFIGQLTVDNKGTISPSYTWTGSAIQTTSIEIIDANTDTASMCPTLFMHNYGDGGVQFRMGNYGDKWLYLSSGASNAANRTTDDNTGLYFAGLKINGNTVWHAGNDGTGSGLDADLLDGNHASAFALASHSHSYLPLSGGTLTGDLAANAGISQGGFTILNGSDTWLRTNGETGWYSVTYGGGWYMTDSTYVRTWNGKGVYVSGTLVEASDERFKENIVPLKNSLDKVLALEGVSYNKIETPDRTEIGFIAQQVEAVVPEIVDTDETEEAYKSVSYSRTVALLVEAIKEQDERIKKLESIIETLKA